MLHTRQMGVKEQMALLHVVFQHNFKPSSQALTYPRLKKRAFIVLLYYVKLNAKSSVYFPVVYFSKWISAVLS